MSLFVRKPMAALLNEAGETGSNTLKRTLGAGGLIALGIGAIIGAGLFSITGMAAANHAGPAITISFVVAGLGCAFAGLCYAEFASMIPVAGNCLYLQLCYYGRIHCLDYRLGFSIGIRCGSCNSRDKLERLPG